MGHAGRGSRLAGFLGAGLLLAVGAAVFGRGGSAPAPLAGAGLLLGLVTTSAIALADRPTLGGALRPGPAGFGALALLALAAAGAVHAFYPHAAILRFWACAGAAGAWVTALLAGSDRATNERLRAGIVLVGALAALLALTGTDAAGPFVNPNHLAALLASVLPLAVAGVIFPGHGRAGRFFAAVQGGAGVLCAVALLASGSRGGVLAAVAGLLCLGLCVARSGARRAPDWRLRGIAALAGLALVAATTLHATEALSRFRPVEGNAESSMGFRLSIWDSALQAIRDGGVAGWGLGTFAWVYPAHREPGVPYRVRHAHNDWLEGAVELGWAFPLLALGTAAALVRRGLRNCAARTDRVAVASAAAGLSGLVALGAHALVDFPLQLPPLLWLAGLQAGLVSASSRVGHALGVAPAARTRWRPAAAAACLGLTLSLSLFALREARARAAMAGAEQALIDLAPERAVAQARRAALADPGSAEARALLGRTLLEGREGGSGGRRALHEALGAYEAAIARNPRAVDGYLAVGRTASALGERERAAAAFDRAVALDPRDGRTREARALLRLAEGRTADALIDLRASVAADARGLSRVLPLLWQATADPALARAVTPASADALLRLGEFLETKGSMDEADAAFREAASADPGAAGAPAARARIALSRRRYDEATALASEALRRDARNLEARRLLAGARLAAGDLEGARAAYEALLDREPGDTDAARALADVAQRLGRPQEAVRAWERVRKAHPGSAEARVELARAQRRAGRWAQAVETCRDAFSADPRETACRALLVDLYLERGLSASAKAVLNGWTGGGESSVISRLALARFYDAAGRSVEARQEYRAVLAIDPENAEARTALSRSTRAGEEGTS